ncbi:0c37da83-339e-4224-9175-4ae7ee6e4e69 [Sclerotinia trifoliorum]|uniref:0c37da83-339e-4224-9175-4ae7ee6e4e69 n=1 Tax=Sclerotinia trifoliorum TaxID=28548 RepID=A0A8H2W1Q1_9HELO|nr:0c37da83-339e-4224-9175-4ae7ee6e4e69 [Sclerotinia trifoliorum]
MPSFADQPEEVKTRERKRVRNLLRYYTPEKWKLTRESEDDDFERNGRGLPETTCEAEEQPHIEENPKKAEKGGPDPSKRLRHDPTLTAFAQLGAYRLNTERSFISLMDSHNQYIIAEATRSVSLHTRDFTKPGDEIFLGARILDMHWGICPNTIQIFTAKDDTGNLKTNLVTANQTRYVMNDLAAIEKYKTRPYIAEWPYMRYYAEVPIYSPENIVIGTYCVVDNKPRYEGLDDDGLEILNEIARAIMRHLVLIEKQDHLERGEKMVKGLGLFVAGKSNLGEGLENYSPDERNPQNESNSRAVDTTGAASISRKQTDICQTEINSVSTPNQSKGSSCLSGFEKPIIMEKNRPSISRSSSAESARQASFASTRLKQLFSRASQLILEAMNLDGVVFVDACFRDSASKIASKNRFLPGVGLNGPQDWAQNGNGIKAPLLPIDMKFEGKRTVKPLTSDLLGCKVRRHQNSSQLDDLTDITLLQATVKGLMTCYTQGRMFVCHEDGSLDLDLEPEPLEVCENGNMEPDRTVVVAWVAELMKICPGARTIVFFPLRDPQRDQWFAGSLAWTTKKLRIVTPEDLTYLTAFGNCIMAEKSRLDSELADRAKSDFISVVSHELRSPLHGVLASAEALRDTSTGDEQDDMIRSITICGEVLLDTMDHILDYAKIANKGETKDMKDLPVQSSGPNTNFDLSNLIETVVEGVSAAQSFRQLTFEAPLCIDTDGLDMNVDENGLSDSVVIVLEIDWQASWAFNSQISSWRRIFINLFQNALKYTEFGYVHVRLTAHQSIDGPVAKLSIIDSGKGISNDYLKYELWTPFVQEDPMSIGTGLGLSIVGKLVQELDGTIDILSTVGTGTAVQVEIPVKHSIPSDEEEETESKKLIFETKERCRGLSMCLLGLDNYPDPCEIPTDAPSAKERRMTAIKSALINYAGNWFGMVIRKACSGFCTDGVIFVCLKSQLQFADRTRHKPLIVFEDNMGASNKEDGVFYLTQPAGPFKLARILGQCIDYLHSAGFIPNIIERSSMSSRVPSSIGSPPMLTPPANGYPDSKNVEACRNNVDEGRPSLDSRQNSSESTESVRPKFDARKHSSESTDSAVDMRTSEEPIVAYHTFPFSATSPLRSRNEREMHMLNNPEVKSNEEPMVLDKTVSSKGVAVSNRVRDLEKSFSVLQVPVGSDESVLLKASPVLQKLALVEKTTVLETSSIVEKPTVIEKAPITQNATICEKPIVPEKPAVLQIVKSEPSITPTIEKSARTVVLLVEDNAINLKVLVHSMKKLKEEYDTASNGLQAFEKYKKAPGTFKIIFMDISMPIMDGLTSTRHIREYESTHGLSRVRIVALTCFGTEEHRRDAAMSGVDLFLTKPIHLKSLKPVVDLDPEGVRGGVMEESI